MSDAVAVRRCPSELGGIVCRILRNEHIVVGPLLRRIYYVGLAAIAGWSIFSMLQFVSMAIEQPGAGSIGFFIVAAFVGFSTVAWRLGCELALALLLVLAV